jgi:hypothetical protein
LFVLVDQGFQCFVGRFQDFNEVNAELGDPVVEVVLSLDVFVLGDSFVVLFPFDEVVDELFPLASIFNDYKLDLEFCAVFGKVSKMFSIFLIEKIIWKGL